MTQINFDPDKPEYRSKLISMQVRENFQAVSRANDLRATEQDPPDLTVRVEPGSYAVTSERTDRFAGGNSDLLDTMTGGSATQRRIFVLELDDAGVLHWNSSSYWVTPPLNPVAPAYSASRIPICEVTVTYGDTIIVQDQIADARPMINIGAGTGQALNPGRVVFTATAGQFDFDTSAHFTFTPGQDEILVWCTLLPMVGIPDPSNGLFYKVSGVDYDEISDTTIRFKNPPYNFLGGELVVVWKVGLSATPGTIGLIDLSDVDGDQAAAFQAADAPDAINPFLTESGHNSIDHLIDVPSLAPVATHITTTATGSHKHMADEIQNVDPGAYTNATDVQTVLEDIDTNIYIPYVAQHYPTGVHGPNVTINTTSGVFPSLAITNTVGTESILISQGGSAAGIRILQSVAHEGIRVEKSNTDGGSVIIVSNSGSGAGTWIDQIGSGIALYINKTHTGTSAATYLNNLGTGTGLHIQQVGEAAGAAIVKTNTGAYPSLYVENNGSSPGIRVVQSTTIGQAVKIDQYTNSNALFLNKQAPATGAGNVLEIYNDGTGYDIRGHNSNWWIAKTGDAFFTTIPRMAISQELTPPAVGVVYADMINASINVLKVSSSILITLTCMVTAVAGNVDCAAALELRTAAAGAGIQIIEKNPWYKLNPNAHGWDELTIPMSFRYVVTPGTTGIYSVYARMKQVYTPGTIVNMVLTLETIG